MADVTLTYKGSDILELSDSGSATLKTGGKYCEDDIDVEYVKPSGGAQVGFRTATITSAVTANTLTVDMGEPWASTLAGSFSAIDFIWTETSPTRHRVQGCFYWNSYRNANLSVGYANNGSKDWWTTDSGMSPSNSTGKLTLTQGVTAGTTYKICLIVNEVS